MLIKVSHGQEVVHFAVFHSVACIDDVLLITDTSVNSADLMMMQVMQAAFGPSLSALVHSAQQLPLMAANPMDACTALLWPGLLKNAVVLAQRGNCTFATKVLFLGVPPNHKD